MNIHTFLVKNVNYTFEDSFILVLGNEVFGEKESVEYDTSSEHKLISSFPFQLSSICHQQSTVSIPILYFYSYVVSFALTLWRVKTIRDKTKYAQFIVSELKSRTGKSQIPDLRHISSRLH